jgi:MFS transporter, putative metabolite transport protein
MTPTHYLHWLLASGGTLLDGFSVVSLGIALPLLKRDFAIAPAMVGFMGSALVLEQRSGRQSAAWRLTGSAASVLFWWTWRS